MKKQLCITILFAICLATFAACSATEPTYYIGEYNAQAACIYGSTLGFGTMQDEIEIIETDEFGRQLFAFIAVNMFVGEKAFDNTIIVLCISQKQTDTYVYWYDGDNCILKNTEYSGDTKYNYRSEGFDYEKYFSLEEINLLKEINDWNEPVNENKLTAIRYNAEFKKSPLQSEPTNMFRKMKYDITGKVADRFDLSENVSFTFNSKDDCGNCIYTVIEYDASDKWVITRVFLVFVSSDGNVDFEKGIIEVKDWQSSNKQLAQLRLDNGWDKQ